MKKYILPYMGIEKETVILANGEFPAHTAALSILDNCKYLVCCDGAINSLAKTGRIPDAIVGDCDSLSDENKNRFKNILYRIPEQETNDLTKAVNFCLRQGKKDISILGATGKREDHTIANISLLCEYMKICEVEMVTNYGVFVAIDKDSSFESFKGQQVSIFCIDNIPVTSHNLQYSVKNRVFTNWWQASLNESETNEFRIETTGRTIIYRAF